ncbi:MAG: hypothetical protein HXL94_00395 [[Eubacterium] sulci]|jgi:hypothetical protein|nr:hypothetical protein [[Eubacterium] sulci]MBF1170831.1 hypothetical protein [[Eubacterium] sulci]
MNTSKKINEQIYKYTGVIFSLMLIWTFLKDQEDLAADNFLASIMTPILIARELIIMRKSTINKPLLICTLILNLILLIPAFILNYMIPLYKMDEYMYINKTIAIILIVTLPISFGVLYSQKKKAK